MRFYELREDRAPHYTGYSDAMQKWSLPGLSCPVCGDTWATAGNVYPCVDLSSLPERAAFEEARSAPIEEFERLRELVRPLAPPDARLLPGTKLGPSVGTATGHFGALFYDALWTLMVRREALETLRAAGIRGLKGCRAQLRFRQRNAPEFWELQLERHGGLHPECLPPDREPPCERCGGDSSPTPERKLLNAAALPTDLDLFMEPDSLTVVCTERFVETVRRLELDGVTFHELLLR
jgi:uncharacterized double-CXXCG motif protein